MYDVENCEDTSVTMAEKENISKTGRTYCVAGAPNDFSSKNKRHIPDISMHSFSEGCSCMVKMDAFRSSTLRKFY